MAIWEKNKKRYEARLETFHFLCTNFWKYLEAKTDLSPVVSFNNKTWGDIPENLLEEISYEDESTIRSVMIANFFEGREKLAGYTIDDFLVELDWCFNPRDIKDFKICLKAPHQKKKYK